MQAIILAAGMGKRLKELTQNNTKCMVKVNGVSLIDRLLHQLEKQHLSRIVIVVGYEGRILVRESGTEPVVRVMVEAGTHEECEKYVDDVIAVIKEKGYAVE